LDYEVGAAILPAVSVGADHARARIYFVGYAHGESQSKLRVDDQVARVFWDRGDAGNLVSSDGVSSQMAVLRAYGNAIVPQVAAEFIGAYLDG
jgi:DNA (cytosine-5)-methyltransferase 1